MVYKKKNQQKLDDLFEAVSFIYSRLGSQNMRSRTRRQPTTSADKRITRYDAVRLHGRSLDGWAVVGWPLGAIAIDKGDQLLMRLTEAAARDLAEQMSRALKVIAFIDGLAVAARAAA